MDAKELTVADVIPRERYVPQIAPLLDRIRATYAPEAVLLFGSRARGDDRANSDWDLLVILPDDAPESLLDPYLRWQTREGTGVNADLLCGYKSEFLGDIGVANTLAHEIRNDAVRLA